MKAETKDTATRLVPGIKAFSRSVSYTHLDVYKRQDLWLGPAMQRPYHPAYHPAKWRGYIDFGCGAMGDFGCHTLDPAFWALNLGSPESVIASTTNLIPNFKYDAYPTSSIITYQFPKRNNPSAIKLTWYDGGILPLHDDRLKDLKYPACGALLIGEKGIIMHGSHCLLYTSIRPQH